MPLHSAPASGIIEAESGRKNSPAGPAGTIEEESIMNNDEKILELLAKHENTFQEIHQAMNEMRTEMGAIRSDIAEMRTTLTRVAVTQENVVLPHLDTLADGHRHLLDTLASKSRVEALEDDVSTLKSVVKSMSARLAALEKAQ